MPLSAAQTAFLRILAPHQIEGRYPDAGTMETDPDTAREKLARAQEMLKWLSQTL